MIETAKKGGLKLNISVAMAVFNGEKYIKEQIESILPQLLPDDEIIISYDDSADNTYKIIKELSFFDKRIKIIKGPDLGIIKNFENAILNCKNEYIFLSDQDDIWLQNKVKSILSEFQNNNPDLILHDAIIVDENLKELYNSFFKKRNSKPGLFNNIIKNSYIGCCMAGKATFFKKCLPFPKSIPMHDQWIGMIAERFWKISFLNEKLIKYRRHNQNATKDENSSIVNMIKWRVILLKELFLYKKRCRTYFCNSHTE